MFTVAERRADLLYAPPTYQTCGWLDRRLPSSNFISTPALSSTVAMVGRSVPLQVSVFSSLPFLGCLSGGFVEARRAGRLSWPGEGGCG